LGFQWKNRANTQKDFSSASSDKRLSPISYRTSEPRRAVGLGGGSVDAEAFAGQHVAVLGFLHQEAYLCQEAVQEAGKHGRASYHHQVLGEHFTRVNRALREKQEEKNRKE